jgi:drug/metabolite transporter (DMT)-like permease
MSELFAVLCACCSAVSSIFISELKGRLPLLQLIKWQIIAAFAMNCLFATMLGKWSVLEPWQFGLLAGSGISGVVIAGTAYISTIHATGPRITALLFSLTAPFSLGLGYLFLGETASLLQLAGVILVLTGIVLAIGIPRRFLRDGFRKPPMPAPVPAVVPVPPAPSPPVSRSLVPGILLGVFTAFGQAVGLLLARPAMASGVDPFNAMTVRTGVAALCFGLLGLLGIGGAGGYPADPRSWRLILSASLTGTTLGMIFLMAALGGGNTGLVATLSSTTPVAILPMIWLAGKEKPSAAAWVGALVAIAGIWLISVR